MARHAGFIIKFSPLTRLWSSDLFQSSSREAVLTSGPVVAWSPSVHCDSNVLKRLQALFEMAQHDGGVAALDEEIKPYSIHVSSDRLVPENSSDRLQQQVSSKYLKMTRQKLELTRLPHDIPEPRSNAWWEPKPTIEPLIDYWCAQIAPRRLEPGF